MLSIATKTRAENKSYKKKYKALKELEKGTPHMDVASPFGVPKNTLSTWKKKKDKTLKSITVALFQKRVKPEKYKELKKDVHKWFLVLCSENVPISGPILEQNFLKFAGGLNIEGFQASEGWLEKWKKR